MNYYIDFDNTLFNTQKLTKSMLENLANSIVSENNSLKFEEVLSEEKNIFNSNNIYNIFELCEFFGNKYNINSDILISNINSVINK